MKASEPRAHFGRKQGHKLRAAQSNRLEEMLPGLALDLTIPAPEPLARLFDEPPSAVQLEIGFGGGEHLLHQAAANPNTGFIGCEAFRDGVAKLLGRLDEKDLKNVRLHPADAVLLLPWLPDASIDLVYLLYPDPWPKRRHWKRRFINDSRLADIARVLKPGGRFRFASDISTNITWTLMHILRSGSFVPAMRRATDWQTPWPGWISTRYEQKALREGRRPAYLEFVRETAATGPV